MDMGTDTGDSMIPKTAYLCDACKGKGGYVNPCVLFTIESMIPPSSCPYIEGYVKTNWRKITRETARDITKDAHRFVCHECEYQCIFALDDNTLVNPCECVRYAETGGIPTSWERIPQWWTQVDGQVPMPDEYDPDALKELSKT